MISTLTTPKPRLELRNGITRALAEKSEGRTDEMLWLDKNEGTDPEYIELIKKILADIPVSALYAYPDAFNLYQKLANYLHVDINQLLIAGGSDSVIRSVYEAFVAPGDVVIHPEPTFLMYSVYAKIYGAKPLVLNYEKSNNGPVLALSTVLHAIKNAKPRLVCLPNPGSPTGTVFTKDELHQIIKTAGEVGAVVLIDEAYYPFYPETMLHAITDYPHLIISRTFSKAWGLAGIRVGFGVACKELMVELHKVRPRYETGSLSMAVAERVLDYPKAMLDSVHRLNQGKYYFLEAMQKLGFQTINAHGNFFHVLYGEKSAAVHASLKNKVLYQQDFKHPSLQGYSRFTTTTSELFMPVVDIISSVV